MYIVNTFPGVAGPAPVPVQTSAKHWEELQRYTSSLGKSVGCSGRKRVQIGRSIYLVPAFSRMKALGQDDITDELDPFASYDTGAESEYSTSGELATDIDAAAASGAYSPYTLPVTAAGSALIPGSVASNAAISAGSSAYVPGTTGYNALLQAGLTAAQISALAIQHPGGIPNTSGAIQPPSLIPGVSNTILFFGGAIALIVLASAGGRRK